MQHVSGEIGLRWNPFLDSEIKISGYYQNYQQMITLQYDPTVGTVRAGIYPKQMFLVLKSNHSIVGLIFGKAV